MPSVRENLRTADLSEAQHQQAGEGTQNLPLSAARPAGGPAKPGLVRGHHLSADAPRFPLFGRDHGLSYPDGSVVADLEHAGRELLRRGAERSHLPVRTTGHHEQRPGIAVHLICVDRPLAALGRPHIHGW